MDRDYICSTVFWGSVFAGASWVGAVQAGEAIYENVRLGLSEPLMPQRDNESVRDLYFNQAILPKRDDCPDGLEERDSEE